MQNNLAIMMMMIS